MSDVISVQARDEACLGKECTQGEKHGVCKSAADEELDWRGNMIGQRNYQDVKPCNCQVDGNVGERLCVLPNSRGGGTIIASNGIVSYPSTVEHMCTVHRKIPVQAKLGALLGCALNR